MRRTKWLLSLLFVFSLAVWAQTDVDRAYNNGYQAGFQAGQNDARDGLAMNVSRSSIYQQGTQGWEGSISRTRYRESFRSGFQSGYQNAYRQATSGTSPQNDTLPDAFQNGYREGYNAGRGDAGASYRLENNSTYRDAILGYDASRFGSLAAYQSTFRQGFKDGYNDAYYGRAYDERRNVPRLGPQGQTSSIPSGAAQQARDNGYREGYEHGEEDSDGAYRPKHDPAYLQGTEGYNADLSISRMTYRREFRRGYLEGYDDAYHGRQARIGITEPRGVGTYGQDVYSSDVYNRGSLAQGVITVPAGTVIRMRLNEDLTTKTAQPGQQFTATVTEPVYTPNSQQIAIPANSIVRGTVTDVEQAGRVTGSSQLRLRYDTISMPQAGDYRIDATTAQVGDRGNVRQEEGEIESKKTTTRDVGTVAAGAVLGALIGGIAGGGKGAGIGAAVGGAAGLGTVLVTRNSSVDLPAGTAMEVRLDQPLTLRR